MNDVNHSVTLTQIRGDMYMHKTNFNVVQNVIIKYTISEINFPYS